MNLQQLIYETSVFSVLVPLLFGLYIYKKLDTNSRLILLLLICSTVAQFASYIMHDPKNFWKYYNLYLISDCTIWAFLFLKNIKWLILKWFIKITYLIQCLFFLQKILHEGISNRFFIELVCLSYILEVTWVLAFLWNIYKIETIESLEVKPIFWFCLGLLICLPTTYFIIAFYRVLRIKNSFHENIFWSLHGILNVLMYLIFAIGIYYNLKGKNYQLISNEGQL